MKSDAATGCEEVQRRIMSLREALGRPLSSFADLKHGFRYSVRHPAFKTESETALFAQHLASSSKWVLFEPRCGHAIEILSDLQGRIVTHRKKAGHDHSDASRIKPEDLTLRSLFYPVDLLQIIVRDIRWKRATSFPLEQLRDKTSFYLDEQMGVHYCARIGRRPRVIGKTIWALYEVSHPSIVHFVRSDHSVGVAFPNGNSRTLLKVLQHLDDELESFGRVSRIQSLESILPSYLFDQSA